MLGPQDLGIQVYMPLAGSVRFEAPGTEQVGIVTGLLEGGVLCFIPLWSQILILPLLLHLSGGQVTHLQNGGDYCYHLTVLSN